MSLRAPEWECLQAEISRGLGFGFFAESSL